MKLGMSLFLMIAAFSYVELTSAARLYGQGQPHKMIDPGTSGTTARDGETADRSTAANADASDFPYMISNVSITSRIELIEPLRRNESGSGRPASLQCTLPGRPCAPHSSSCCPGLRCVFFGGSTRVGYQCR